MRHAPEPHAVAILARPLSRDNRVELIDLLLRQHDTTRDLYVSLQRAQWRLRKVSFKVPRTVLRDMAMTAGRHLVAQAGYIRELGGFVGPGNLDAAPWWFDDTSFTLCLASVQRDCDELATLTGAVQHLLEQVATRGEPLNVLNDASLDLVRRIRHLLSPEPERQTLAVSGVLAACRSRP
ncbi:hypothetical protein [Pseudomonas sp. GD03944]|uniref:hypothetical protein n=1 Tax=Pseudomonas sp. GD03944 TaxID=2975409 RepID=UPI0024488370|nr:hypothetical protein [Pseudomonas sp. GD03944]MDH1262112.1 hypothetical protein [Pseudomonas sp. GD03944]